MKRLPTLLFVIAWLLLPGVGLSQSSATTDSQFLSGAWEGTQSTAQRGSCAIGGESGPSTGIHYEPVRFLIRIDAGGSLSAEIYFQASKKPASTWAGKIDKDFNVQLVAPQAANCNGQPRNYNVTYVGRVLQKKGKFELELKGAAPTCPEMKCIFEMRVQLKKK